MAAKQSLGRGFESLIPKDLDPDILAQDKNRVQKLLISDIVPNPDQPRREFDSAQLNDLAESIRVHGVLQPIIVVRYKNGYRIVAGERRWRAAGLVKLKDIPAIVRSLKELEEIELSLIENIQRVDLSPLEQALAVLKLQQQFNLSLEQISQKLGKASSTVSNLTRLLQLPDDAREALRQGKISEGHARAILALRGDNAKQKELLSCILNNKWTVRQAEEFVIKARRASKGEYSPDEKTLVRDLSSSLGTKVSLRHTSKGGQLIISFQDKTQLDRILKKLDK
ncbi:MAG TPA: ParB/RepB/Spo0J family partition protein [Candidatus Binatia bacterium]|nr:ParB/RepB/Spo0J family partition protein [Candidatus Binatia bacterium]